MTKITWKHVPSDVRDQLLSRYEDGETLADTAEAFGMSLTSLRRYVRNHRENTRALLEREDSPEAASIRALVLGAEPQIEIFPPDAYNKLTDIVRADPRTDQAKWVRALKRLRDEKGSITVMHLHDIHAPFQNEQALEVVLKLVKHVQPDVIVVGSDAADFALLSSFAHDPDMDEDMPDELDVFRMFWNDFIRKLKRAAPKAILVYIYGNHEVRIFRFLGENARKLRKTVLREFIEIVRFGGTRHKLA